MGVVQVVTVAEVAWQPSFELVLACVFWMLVSSGLIFVNMLEDFMGATVGD